MSAVTCATALHRPSHNLQKLQSRIVIVYLREVSVDDCIISAVRLHSECLRLDLVCAFHEVMAEVLPPHSTQGRLVHSTDANIAPQAGSLWTNSSWFSTPPAPCPNDRPRHELPTPAPCRSAPEVIAVRCLDGLPTTACHSMPHAMFR
jgi:hypothetical protein